MSDLIGLKAIDFKLDDETVENTSTASIGLRVGDTDMRFVNIGEDKDGKHRVSKSDSNLTFLVAHADVARLTGQIPGLKPAMAEAEETAAEDSPAVDAAAGVVEAAVDAGAEAVEDAAEVVESGVDAVLEAAESVTDEVKEEAADSLPDDAAGEEEESAAE